MIRSGMTEFTTDMLHKYPGLAPQVLEFGTGSGQLNDPWFVDADEEGRLCVADTYNDRVQIFDTTNFMPSCVYNNDFLRPRSVKFTRRESLGYVTVADTGNRRVLVLPRPGNESQAQCTFEVGVECFREPTDTVVDPTTGYMFVTDTSVNKVFMVTERVAEFQSERQVSLDQPMAIAMDDRGRIFVADTGHKCIQIFDRNGAIVGRIQGAGSTNGGQLNRPKGICVDKRGYIFVADESVGRVVQFSPDLRMMSVVVRQLLSPKGVAINNNNQLFVTTADRNNVVKLFNP